MPSINDALRTPVAASLPCTWTIGEALVFLAEAYEATDDPRVADAIALSLQAACIAAGAGEATVLYELGFLTELTLDLNAD